MSRHLLLLYLLISALSITGVVYGDTPIEPIPAGEDQIVTMRRGGVAPFAGQLFSIDTAIRWGNWLAQYRYHLRLDVKRERDLRLLDTELQDAILDAEKARAHQVELSLTTQLTSSEVARIQAEELLRNPPWYRTVTFGATIGVIGTVLVMVVGIWALEARRE